MRLLPVLTAAIVLAAAAAYTMPRAAEKVAGLDDPARIAASALDGKFDGAVAQHEIEVALAAGDADLAQSFVDLATDRQIGLDPMLTQRVKAATAEAAGMRHKATSFARGFVSGEPDDMAALAGTAVGDLFVFGDIRDALREGYRYAAGEKVDRLVVGLAAADIAITAGTYATFGAAAPARAGVSFLKAARKTGVLGAELAGDVGRMVRQVSALAVAVRAAREGVKAERAGGLFKLAGDVGRIERAAGGRAALDGIRIAREPRDLTRVAKLAEKEGSRTRAILKVAGSGAVALAALALDASAWLLGALFALFGFVSALKNATERMTLRFLRRRRERRTRNSIEPIAVAPACG
ncbi:MAG TPA: hypothetical protein VEH02_01880 [Pseudolabrys sp.]|nr:hypothetical protein [Pseudolabrys sp.]